MLKFTTIDNDMGLPVHRVISNDLYYVEELFSYDSQCRMVEHVKKNRSGKIISVEKHENIYDNQDYINEKNTILKVYSEDSNTNDKILVQSVNHYKYINKVSSHKLVSKVCICNNKQLYSTNYIYGDDKLVATEQLDSNNNISMYGSFTYSKNSFLLKKYFAGGQVSHYYIYEVMNNKIVRRKLISPSKSNYKWYISSIDVTCCIITLREDQLLPSMFIDILGYINESIKDIDFFIIDYDATDVETYREEISKIQNDFERVHNIRMVFNM